MSLGKYCFMISKKSFKYLNNNNLKCVSLPYIICFGFFFLFIYMHAII